MSENNGNGNGADGLPPDGPPAGDSPDDDAGNWQQEIVSFIRQVVNAEMDQHRAAMDQQFQQINETLSNLSNSVQSLAASPPRHEDSIERARGT